MSKRNDDTAKLIVGAFALWGFVRLLSAGKGSAWFGEGGDADERSEGPEGKRDELAQLPDELDPEVERARIKTRKAKKGEASGVPIIDVYGPAKREPTAEELARLTPAQRAAYEKRAAKKRAADTKKAPPKSKKPAGTISASPELEPHHGPTLPAGYDPAKARARAPVIAAHLAAKGPKAYSRSMLKDWQRYAGLRVDGIYAGSTRGALIFYGVPNPPRPFGQPVATLPYHPPDLSP